MTTDMSKVLCTKSHEYLLEEDAVLKVGLTDFAVEQLGDIVFVELPEVGSKFSKGEIFGTIESVKAASDIYLPVEGEILEINEKVIETPELVNEDCFGEGWLVKVSGYSEEDFSDAMEYDDYKEYVKGA